MSNDKNIRHSPNCSSEDVGYGSSALLSNTSIAVQPYRPGEDLELVDNQSPKNAGCSTWNRFVPSRENLLFVLTISGVLLGIMLGFLVRKTDPSETAIELINFPGELLMRALKMMIIPVIITSIVSGLANLDMKKSGRVGLYAVSYYLATTTMAVLLGIILVTVIHPGDPDQRDVTNNEEKAKNVSPIDTYLDLIRNIIPDNIIAACFELIQTSVTRGNVDRSTASVRNITETMKNESTKITRIRERVHNPNILGLITFFIAFGVSLSSLGDDGKPLKRIFQLLNDIFMKMITVVIWYSPVGICFLIAANIVKLGSLRVIGETLGLYILTVTTGLMIHGFIVLPVIYYIFTRKNPCKLAYGVLQAIMTALGTSSSAATLPITMRCLENNLGIDERVTRFVLPLGATMNMDGTALLEGVASITIAQMYSVQLSVGQIATISITATVASIGAAAIPSAGLITLILVLTAIGIPTDAVALLWSIDWFLDRMRTAVNVFGDCVGAAIVYQKNKHLLEKVVHNEKSSQKINSPLAEIVEESSALMQSST